MPLPLETARFDALKALAAQRFGEITPAEEEVLRLSASTEDRDTPKSEDRPEVRAAFLRWLATDKGAAAHIDPFGLRVENATITSPLDLDCCKISFPLRFERCTLQGVLSLRSAELPALDLTDCKTEYGISADCLRTQGPVFLRRLGAKGEIRFPCARIGGVLDCSGATLTARGDALNAEGADIAGSVFLNKGFSCSGETRLLCARIGGDLVCSGAALTAEGIALNARMANIVGSVCLIERFSCSGTIRLPRARIGGDLDCSGARISVLMCEHMCLEGALIWTAIRSPKNSCLDLFGATVRMLSDDTASWPAPGDLAVNGLEYRDLTHHGPSTEDDLSKEQMAPQRKLDAGERVRWLNLQDKEDRLDPQPWMWLAKLFKEKDDIAGFRHIVCAYRCMKARTHRNRAARLFGVGMAHLERNPWRILWLFVPLLLLGALIFWLAANAGYMPPTSKDVYSAWATGKPFPIAYPQFNSIVYTLENELPVVKFGMDDKWAPNPNLIAQGKTATYWWLAGFRWFLILAGWVQGILLTFGITRRFRD